MRRSVWALIVVVVMGVLVTWRLVQTHRAAQALVHRRVALAQAPPQVAVDVATVRDVVNTYQTTGTLQAVEQVKIAPKVTGRVVLLGPYEGDQVAPGQVVARLDSDEVEANVRQAEANWREAQWKLAQSQTTQSSNDVSISTQIGQQTAAVNSARTTYQQLLHNRASQIAAAQAAVRQAQGQVDSSEAAIRSAQSDLHSAVASRDNAVIQYNRTYTLYSQGFSAAQDVDTAKSAARVAEAAVSSAQGKLNNAIGARDTARGELSAAQEQLRIVLVKTDADIETARQSLAQAEEALRLACANRTQIPAYRQGVAALKSAAQAARQALAQATAQRADTVLVSPLSGFVTQRLVDPGTTVTAGQTILTLEAFGVIWVTFGVPSNVIHSVQKGQLIGATFGALGGKTFRAAITQINPSAESDGRQYTIRATLDNRMGRFKPGMFARVRVTTASAPRVVTVPPEALRTSDGASSVVVVDAGKVAHLRPVQAGLSDGNHVAVTGVRAGERVIVLGGDRVQDGQTVTPSPVAETGQHGATAAPPVTRVY